MYTLNLPTSIKAGYLNCLVRPYVPNPMRCFQYQRFVHTKMSCRSKPTCARCSGESHDSDNCTAEPLCINCKGAHPTFSRICPKWKDKKEVQTVKVMKNISYAKARRIVQSSQLRSNTSYASITKSTRTIACQTIYSLPKSSQAKQQEPRQEISDKSEPALSPHQITSKNKETKSQNKKSEKLRSPSNSFLQSLSFDSQDSDGMEVEEGLSVPKHLLPRKSKKEHRKNKHS
ncbi:uncharacterized protein LOC118199777 [Stegodyphus dumicola]|uniref:uncharacterized protein LOC118199777 n=1 Tax=Stegodyphus dumicola TaxID=202533 RepID=UPI0015AC26ED|nr:uncharacterized protein LOC118199777 [Stegodyphus dumicola]